VIQLTNYQQYIQATKNQVTKLLELDDEEKEILEAGMSIVAAIGYREGINDD